MKSMLVMANCAKNYGSPIYQSLLESAGDATRHNSFHPFSIDLPTYMILSVTSIEEFPGDGYTLL